MDTVEELKSRPKGFQENEVPIRNVITYMAGWIYSLDSKTRNGQKYSPVCWAIHPSVGYLKSLKVMPPRQPDVLWQAQWLSFRLRRFLRMVRLRLSALSVRRRN